MTISIWRYSHLVLSIICSIFLLILSVTGGVLSLGPVMEKSQGLYIDNSSGLTLAEVITCVKNKHEDVINLEVDKNGFVILESGEGRFYINPFTGEKIGQIKPKSQFFSYVTSLHRSLFLGTLGRGFLGCVSFLFFFIAFSGIILLIKRQNSLKKVFGKIAKDTSEQYYHIIFGRLTVIPLLVLSVTGTYLSAVRFKLLPIKGIEHNVDLSTLVESSAVPFNTFEVFRKYTLGDLSSISFPLFEDIQEIYNLKLKDKELYINQFSGTIESEQSYPFSKLVKELSFNLHTGSGSIIWSLILGISALAIPYFIYSGFAMTLARRKGRINNVYKKDDAEFIILVGSENGSTWGFAKMLHEGIINLGKKSFIADMNSFSNYKNMKQLLVFTSTYGVGESPVNANKFIDLFNLNQTNKPFDYSIVGFGSLAYPDFCKYAYDVEKCFSNNAVANKVMDIHTINNKSFESFSTWVTEWGKVTSNKIVLPKLEIKRKKTVSYKVISKTDAVDNPDQSFLVELKSNKKQKMVSGDLLGVYPEGDDKERLYSLAVINGNILLSVKRHHYGVCSNYLNDLKIGSTLEGYIIRNKEFYFPDISQKTIMIATGTGISPFLGMIQNNIKSKEVYLYWGAKNKESFKLYERIITYGMQKKRLTGFIPAYSRETNQKIYVQNLIERDHHMVVETLKLGGVIMICGSISMQKEIIEILGKYCLINNQKSISYYIKNHQIRIDCY